MNFDHQGILQMLMWVCNVPWCSMQTALLSVLLPFLCFCISPALKPWNAVGSTSLSLISASFRVTQQKHLLGYRGGCSLFWEIHLKCITWNGRLCGKRKCVKLWEDPSKYTSHTVSNLNIGLSYAWILTLENPSHFSLCSWIMRDFLLSPTLDSKAIFFGQI